MSFKELDPFNYIDIKPQNYKSKQQLMIDLEDISKTLENITNEWKEREESLQKLSSISIGNYSKSELFVKYFNSKLATSLEIQLSDLRSSVMKEACRTTSLCARELGLLIEQGITQLLTQTCLFKIAGSANKVISDSSSKCILNIVRYVNCIKVITNICEIRVMKANSVRILCAQCLVNIISYYDNAYIIRTKDIIEETIKNLLSDANAEVRLTARRAFILYKSRFEKDAEILFNELGKNVQKQINEDEKNYDNNLKVKVRCGIDDKLLNLIDKQIDENLDNINYKEIVQTKPKTPEFNLLKKKGSQDIIKKENNISDIKHIKSNKKSGNKIHKNYIGEKKEETVKYINVDDDDDGGENGDGFIDIKDDDEEEGEEKNKIEEVDMTDNLKKQNNKEDSMEINAVFNYINNPKKKLGNKINKIGFNKKSQNKKNESNNNKLIENKNSNSSNKLQKDDKEININSQNKLIQSQNLNIINFNNKNISNSNNNINANNINDLNNFNIDDILNTNIENNNKNIMINNSTRVIKSSSNSATDNTSNVDSSQNNSNNANKNKNKQKNNELNNRPNIRNNKNQILKKLNTKLDKLESNASSSSGNALSKNKNIIKDGKKRGKSSEKMNNFEFNKIKNIKTNNAKKNSNSNWKKEKNTAISNSKTIENKPSNIKINESDDMFTRKMLSRQVIKGVETVNLNLEDSDEDEEEEIDKVIDIDNNREQTKTYNYKSNNNYNNIGDKDKMSSKINTYHFSKSNNKKENNKNNLINSNNINIDNFINNTLNNNNNNMNNNNESIQDKVNVILDKLDNLINQNEKLILFQYLFNYFNSILQEIDSFSHNTIKRYIDIHIENLKENDKNLVEQVIKNLMRMIFYMNKIFNTYSIESILKILLFSINELNDKTITKLSDQLLEIIKKKCDNEELFKSVYSLLGEYNCNYDSCYQFLYLLIPECDNILNNSNYFKQVFRLICLTDNNSKKVGKIIDILYRKYSNNFNQAYDEETPENKKQILMFMEKSNSLYYREFKSLHETSTSINLGQNKYSNLINKSKINNNEVKIKIDANVNDNENINKDNINNKNNNLINNYVNPINKNENITNNITTKNNVIYNQNNKNSNNIDTINANINDNNIISINNSNNNNIIITNKSPDDTIPNEIKMSIQNNNLEQYIFYMEEHKSYIPEYILLLSNKKYNDSKSVNTLLTFTKTLLNSNNFIIDLNPCINLMVKQLIYLLNLHKNDEKIVELVKNILSDMPIYLNAEKSLSSISKFLTLDNDIIILETLLMSIQNFIMNSKNKKKNKNENNISLENLLNSFITSIFNLLKHENSEIRKRAVYCCVEIHLIIGKEFEPYLMKIPNAQQNLIRLFIKKRNG